MSLKLAIWDMDGTIVDSRHVISSAMDTAFTAAGLAPPGYDRTRHIVGLGLVDACRELAPENISETALEQLAAAYRQAFVAQRGAPDFHEPLYDGAIDSLSALTEDGWLIAMATGKSRRGIDAVFETHPLADFFDSIHCADDGPGKPHPAMVNAALDALGAEVSQAVMIGDAVHDMRMGRAAGVHSIGVSWGFGTRAELLDAGAHICADTFAELSGALTRFAGNQAALS